MHTIVTGIFHFKVLPLSIASTDTDPPATFPSRNIARYRSGVISLASRRWRRGGGRRGGVNRFRDRETKSGERSMNRSHGLAHRFQEGNGASSSDGGARRWQRDDPPRGRGGWSRWCGWQMRRAPTRLEYGSLRVAAVHRRGAAPPGEREGINGEREDKWGEKSLKGDVSERARGGDVGREGRRFPPMEKRICT